MSNTHDSTPLHVRRFLAHQRVRGFSERTVGRREWSVGLWVEHTGGNLAGATMDDVEEFLANFPGAQTRYSVRSDINQLYRFLVRRGVVEANPVTSVDSPRLPRRGPTPVAASDVRRLLDSTVGQTRLVVMLAAYAGLRVGEIAALRGEDIDLENRVLVVRDGKGSKDATVPLAAELAAELENWPPSGELIDAHSGAVVAARIKSAYRRLGIVARPHDLRHSFGTEAARRTGGNLRLVQKLMRHDSIATTQQYVDWWPVGDGVLDDLYGQTIGSTNSVDPEKGDKLSPCLDLGPCYEMRDRVAALTARIGTTNEPTAAEIHDYLLAWHAVDRSVAASFAELVVVDEDRAREVSDALCTIGMAIVADDELAIWWESSPVHLEEQIARMVERMTDEGYSIDDIASTVAMARTDA